MKTSQHLQAQAAARCSGRAAAFTIVEMMFALGIAAMLVTAVVTFMFVAARTMSGAMTQTSINTDSATVSDFIFNRIRLATFLTNDASGNRLTLAFDDNHTFDLDGDGKSYDDRGHYEYFEFRNGDGTNSTVTDNKLVYKANTNQPGEKILISSRVRVLPNTQVFVVTNNYTVLINFGMLDNYTSDSYQACDIHGVVVSRNRPATKTVINVLP